MKTVLNNSLLYTSFGGQSDKFPLNDKQLNVGVVTPPDKLPNASLSSTINSSKQPKNSLKPPGKKSLTVGDVSAIAAFTAIGLSGLSLLGLIKKRH